ncbi:hypothetical protein EK21DRAFT_94666 [Setomelanomma holmii]|uniref:Uncharacterized protein n=1 Tax=Setomelanomma holmii TaxID=210430 RepID=A0A9P4LGN6_9PLEO|nr:hypothetical protein EK21DRAFT_94666 [Setomelanomma holmii]
MTIWIPWGQTPDTNSFALAAASLLNASLYNPTAILLVHQIDHMHTDRTSITTPPSNIYKSFTWTPISNVSAAIRTRLNAFAFSPISGHCTTSHPTPLASAQYDNFLSGATSTTQCTESLAQKITRLTPLRRFHLSPPSPHSNTSTTTAYTFFAIHTLEAALTWTQRRHDCYRFPLSESDGLGKMYWKRRSSTDADEDAKKLWYCESPGCGERRGLLGLRGHIMYAHAEQPWWDAGDAGGRRIGWACPYVGCVRIGKLGFGSEEELAEHLAGHQRRPSSSVEE